MAKWGKRDKKEEESKEDVIRLSKLKSAVDRIFEDTSETREQQTRYLKEFRGEWWDEAKLEKADSKVFVNYVFSTTMSIAPLLTDNRPTWSVNARQPHMQKMADLYALCLEYLWDKLECDRYVFRWVLGALIMKKGYLQVSFDPDDGIGGELKLDIVDPRTFFIAPGYDDIWKAPMCGTRVARPMSWIRENFPEKGRLVKPEATTEADGAWDIDEKEDWQLHSDNATVYTVWMKDSAEEDFEDEDGKKEKREKYPNGKLMVFTQSVLLSEKPSIYEHGKPPFVDFDDYVDPVAYMGMGEADQIEQLNRSYNRGLQLVDKYVALYCDPNWLVDESAGVSSQTVKRDLPEGGNVFSYNGMSNAEPIKRLQMGEMPSTLFNFLTATPAIIEEVSGVTEISKGMATKTERQTAAEISTLIESSYTRTRQRVRNLEMSLKRLAWMMIELMQQFYTEERGITLNRDESVEYRKVSSSPEFMQKYMKPNEPNNQEDPQQQAEFQEELADYEKFLEQIQNLGEVDQVYADFDIVIESNSTLPMDKQSLANLFLRLVQLKVIDPEALLSQLKIPGWKKIVARMKEQAMAQAQAKAGGPQKPRVQGQAPAPPQDVQDLLSAQARPEGV